MVSISDATGFRTSGQPGVENGGINAPCNLVNSTTTQTSSTNIPSSASTESSSASTAIVHGSISSGTIAGIAIGVIIALFIMLALLAFLYRRRRRQIAHINSGSPKLSEMATPYMVQTPISSSHPKNDSRNNLGPGSTSSNSAEPNVSRLVVHHTDIEDAGAMVVDVPPSYTDRREPNTPRRRGLPFKPIPSSAASTSHIGGST